MIGNFSACDAFTAPTEGGLSMDPTDPGNWTGGKIGDGQLLGTKYGIACADHPGVDIAALTPADAAAIRKAGYWMPNRCDDLAAGVDLMVYDEDVNAGDGRSAIILERALGTTPDGQVGQNDVTAANALDAATLINKLAAAQAAFYESLPLFASDGKGWLARLAARRTAALAMVAAPAAMEPPAAAAKPGWLNMIGEKIAAAVRGL